MTALLYVDHLAVGHLRTAVAVAYRQVGEAAEHVQTRKDAAVLLDHGDVGLDLGYQLRIYLDLKRIDTLLRAEDLLFVFLQFLCNIPFGIDEGLLPYPFLRNAFFVGIAHLEVISEYIVETYLQR